MRTKSVELVHFWQDKARMNQTKHHSHEERFRYLICIVIFISIGVFYFSPAFAIDQTCHRTLIAHLHKDHEKYIEGMDKSSLQKVAFASLARPGDIMELGSGSGKAAYDLAVLLPDSKIIGIDLDSKMIEYSKSHHVLPNLQFQIGNAEEKNFPNASQNAIFMSSTAHHLTSYGEGEFDVAHVHRAIAQAVTQLKEGGIFILRDFLAPPTTKLVYLDLPNDDGHCMGSPKILSTACLFIQFARDFRSSVHPKSGVAFTEESSPTAGWRRFKLLWRDAVEFLLRKDYRDHYDAEIKEEYTFFNQAQYEEAFRQAGLRILNSTPIFNPWIVENRFRNKVRISDMNNQNIPFPATNYVIVGEKIHWEAGQYLKLAKSEITAKPQFLRLRRMKQHPEGFIYEVAERPNETIDLLPYFKKHGRFFVLGKQGFPRPIVTPLNSPPSLNGLRSDGYVIEPLNFLHRGDKPFFKELEEQLKQRSGILSTDILKKGPHEEYRFYNSPALVTELTRSVAIPISSRNIDFSQPADNYSGFSSSGVIRPFEVTQLLRSTQVGATVDARMELATYGLLLDQNLSAGPWIGEDIQVDAINNRSVRLKISEAHQLLSPSHRSRVFKEISNKNFGSFLEVHRGFFQEFNTHGNIIAEAEREYVTPKNWSSNVITIFPIISTERGLFVGLEKRQLPAVQLNEGNSDMITEPAFRIPKYILDLDSAKEFAV